MKTSVSANQSRNDCETLIVRSNNHKTMISQQSVMKRQRTGRQSSPEMLEKVLAPAKLVYGYRNEVCQSLCLTALSRSWAVRSEGLRLEYRQIIASSIHLWTRNLNA